MRYNTHINKIITKYAKKKVNINQYLLILSATTQMIFLNFKSYAVLNCTVELSKNKNLKKKKKWREYLLLPYCTVV